MPAVRDLIALDIHRGISSRFGQVTPQPPTTVPLPAV
jgi:hypothetical protein